MTKNNINIKTTTRRRKIVNPKLLLPQKKETKKKKPGRTATAEKQTDVIKMAEEVEAQQKETKSSNVEKINEETAEKVNDETRKPEMIESGEEEKETTEKEGEQIPTADSDGDASSKEQQPEQVTIVKEAEAPIIASGGTEESEVGENEGDVEKAQEQKDSSNEEEKTTEKTIEGPVATETPPDGGDDASPADPTDSVAELPLDWTQLGVGADDAMPLRYPHDVITGNELELLEDDDDDICIVGTAGQKITVIGIDFSRRCEFDPRRLKKLTFRSHLIQKMEGLDLFENLESLELYDNMVQELHGLDTFKDTLRVLDMSYNVVRDLSPVATCHNLTELYIAANKLKQIEGLVTLQNLRKIDLGANRIRVLEGLDNLCQLEELWIGKNKIEKIQGLDKLTKLRRLDIQSNRLTRIENLQSQQDTLEELYLAHNGIDDDGVMCESGLALTFPQLNVLDLSRNRLQTTTEFAAHQPSLEELWLSGNDMETFDAIVPLKDAAANGTQQLETVYLEYNPLAKEFEYRKKLSEWIPCLKQIDADLIGGFYRQHGLPSVSTTISTEAAGTMMTMMTTTTTMVAPNLTDQLRQYQAAALDRAKEETKEREQGD